MAKLWRRLIVIVAGLLVLSLAVGMGFSRWYWHYWISPPSVLAWVENFEQVDAVVDVGCEPFQPAESVVVSESDVHRLGIAYLGSPKDYPGDQLWAPVYVTGKQVGRGNVAPITVQAICDELFGSGFVVAGEPGYRWARRRHGNLAAGPSRTGERVYVLSLLGGEASNDHHPVYDVEFVHTGSQRLRIARHHEYFEDVAGAEGLRWFPVALLTFIAGGLVLVAICIGAYAVLFSG
jgi:hypothetical protein